MSFPLESYRFPARELKGSGHDQSAGKDLIAGLFGTGHQLRQRDNFNIFCEGVTPAAGVENHQSMEFQVMHGNAHGGGQGGGVGPLAFHPDSAAVLEEQEVKFTPWWLLQK